MREPRPDWSPLGVNFKFLDELPHLFLYSSPPPGHTRYVKKKITVNRQKMDNCNRQPSIKQ